MVDRLAKTDMGRELGLCTFWEGRAGAETYLPTKRHHGSSSRLTITDMGRKLGALCLLDVELGPI